MKVIWSDFASDILIDIYKYYKEVAGTTIAKKIKSNIFESTKQLKKHPFSGQIEDSLKELREDHRYLVEGNYKIVYKPVKEGILITDVFDSRQDPAKINKTRTKPSR
jgi:toxin ParE1/3/4